MNFKTVLLHAVFIIAQNSRFFLENLPSMVYISFSGYADNEVITSSSLET
jgi:hypothetical protein